MIVLAMSGTDSGTGRTSPTLGRRRATVQRMAATTPITETSADTSSNEPKLHRPLYRPRAVPHTTNTAAENSANHKISSVCAEGMEKS